MDANAPRAQDVRMLNRRHLLGALGGLSTIGVRALELGCELEGTEGEPEELASDEGYWRLVQEAFPVDRSMINLNNGGVCPSPRTVQEALTRHTAFANEAPSYKMWRLLEPQRESVRVGLAHLFGVDAEEVAVTRNASEGLQTMQLGLDLEPGDQVLCTDQDYPRMVTTFLQREAREGIQLVQFPIPAPIEDPGEIVRRYAERITDRTRLILVSQVINRTGAILPVREVVALGRRHGIPVIVDGAHGFAHCTATRDDLDCDYYATSLHKWLFSAVGTGMLFVRRERIGDLWPLMAAPAGQREDIRKFEEIGTHPCPVFLSIGPAITFHRQMGPERKWARLILLRDRWARRLASHDRIRLSTSLTPGLAGGMATVGIEGISTDALHRYLWGTHNIYTTTVRHRGTDEEGRPLGEDAPYRIDGVRISPAPYTTLDEIDRFTEVMEDVLAKGLPG